MPFLGPTDLRTARAPHRTRARPTPHPCAAHTPPYTPALLQPGYVTAWNNLGDAYERRKAYDKALNAYTQALAYAPDNKVAAARADFCRTRIDRRIGS